MSALVESKYEVFLERPAATPPRSTTPLSDWKSTPSSGLERTPPRTPPKKSHHRVRKTSFHCQDWSKSKTPRKVFSPNPNPSFQNSKPSFQDPKSSFSAVSSVRARVEGPVVDVSTKNYAQGSRQANVKNWPAAKFPKDNSGEYTETVSETGRLVIANTTTTPKLLRPALQAARQRKLQKVGKVEANLLSQVVTSAEIDPGRRGEAVKLCSPSVAFIDAELPHKLPCNIPLRL
mmetsp:Transcript_12279/g.16742  ORF Transcript_12279/g.16742 Transcript_12279/m.16742 type:complete len:233 (-) Transcript_12279:131-829(-)